MWKLTFSEPKAWLTFVGSKTLDTNLGMFIPKWGLNIATADKFAKTDAIKQLTTIYINNPIQIKTQKTKNIYNTPSCNLPGKSL